MEIGEGLVSIWRNRGCHIFLPKSLKSSVGTFMRRYAAINCRTHRHISFHTLQVNCLRKLFHFDCVRTYEET